MKKSKTGCRALVANKELLSELITKQSDVPKVWMAAFEKVFAKMLAHGSNTLYDLQ